MRSDPERALGDETGQGTRAPIAPRPATAVDVEGVHKRFGPFNALADVSLNVRSGELLALLGPSGSGKTTLLRLIAGLEAPDGGRIRFDGDDVTTAPAAKRGVGFVFQQYALFKHMTVARNIAFGLEVKPRKARPGPRERQARVDSLLDLVQLPGLGARYPSQLSGGQRQRVALARAMAVSPRILLLDEPFGALDAQVRKALRRELRRIHDATGLTTIFVTHDQEEALELADRVAILNRGRLEQVDAPRAVVDNPASAFVAGFVGQAHPLKGVVRAGVFHFPGVVPGVVPGVALEAKACPDGPALAFVPPDQIGILDGAETGSGLSAVIVRKVVRGPVLVLECVIDGGALLDVAIPRAEAGRAGGEGGPVRLDILGGRVFPA